MNDNAMPPEATAPLRVISTQDIVIVDGLTQEDRHTVAQHWNATGQYLDTGNTTPLTSFEGVTVGGYNGVPEYELETRLEAIEFHGTSYGPAWEDYDEDGYDHLFSAGFEICFE